MTGYHSSTISSKNIGRMTSNPTLPHGSNLTLGDLIDVLVRCPQNKPVRFDTGATTGQLSSWRGVYAELSLEPMPETDPVTVGDLLSQCTVAASGIVKFEAYKGGTYTMSRSTPPLE